MDDIVDVFIPDPSRPTWENMVNSPTIEQVSSKYKLKLRYKGFFKIVKNSNRRKYCFGSQKCIYIDTRSFDLSQLNEEVLRHYSSRSDLVLSTFFVDKYGMEQSFIELNSDENFVLMLIIEEPHGEEDSDQCPSDESYFSHFSSDDNNGHDDDVEISSDKKSFESSCIINEFEYFIEKSDLERVTARCAQEECPWRIHASLMQDKVTFEVKVLKETHTCTLSNMGGNKHATQGWIASLLTDKIKSDGDVVTVTELRKWLMKNYNVNIPYNKVFRGKEQAYIDIYGKWDDSFVQMGDFKEELQNRNPGSVVDIDFETVGDKKCFKRFFISLAVCSKGFLVGCRPYISLDAFHLKGKFNGVLAAAIGIDDGLVISSDMQKGLELAIIQVYPNVEHRECMRHLYSNFKKQYRGEFFKFKLWGAANTYCIVEHERLLKEIYSEREDAIAYLSLNHNKIWSRSKFGTTSKCDYMTNNISEAFNAWIGTFRFQPVLDLLDNIREELLKRFDEKRMVVEKWNGTLVPMAKKYLSTISKNLGEYEVCRSNENHAEVKSKGKRWVVMLDEKKCSCRVWQVKGMPCVHAAAFIAFTRESWEKYVDPYFTIEKFKDAYALEVTMMPGKDKWVHLQTEDKIYPPVIKRPIGRPRKKRIAPADEPKKRHQCRKCNGYGHRQKSCKNPPAQSVNLGETSTTKRRRRKNKKGGEGFAEKESN